LFLKSSGWCNVMIRSRALRYGLLYRPSIGRAGGCAEYLSPVIRLERGSRGGGLDSNAYNRKRQSCYFGSFLSQMMIRERDKSNIIRAGRFTPSEKIRMFQIIGLARALRFWFSEICKCSNLQIIISSRTSGAQFHHILIF
jgi:hypothetical protein